MNVHSCAIATGRYPPVTHRLSAQPPAIKNTARRRRDSRVSASSSTQMAPEKRFITQEDEQSESLWSQVCSVDCTHPHALTLTHHKTHRNPNDIDPADTSTGLVLNVLRSPEAHPSREWLDKPYVTCNHFDVDALTSVWAYLYRELALQYSEVVELVAHLGDFREGRLEDLCDGSNSVMDQALKVCCWLNTMEREKFSKPWEVKDSEEKFEWFLPRFQDVLADPDTFKADWEAEYRMVREGFEALEGRVSEDPLIGLAIARPDAPMHYYSLFSRSPGSDVLLTVYPGNKYELEAKYTQYVQFHSRPVWPRLDFGPLAKVLNVLEEQCGGDLSEAAWSADRLVYGGPMLRLDRPGTKLTTVQKYGHPFDRPIYASKIPPERFEEVVSSFMEFGLRGCEPRAGGFSWEELQRLNREIKWGEWEASWRQ